MAVVTAEIRFAPKNAAWFTTNAALVLADGEIVYRSTDGKYIIGDGTTAVSGLTFYGGTSTTYTSSNGVTLTGSNFTLGGALTGNTSLTGNFSLSLGTSGSPLSSLNSHSGSFDFEAGTNGSALTLSSTTGLFAVSPDAVNYVSIQNTTAGQTVSDTSTNNRIVIRDDVASKGLVGYADYSANVTNNSYVQKSWVTAQSYLTAAAAALAYQPLDSDLTSWAGVTRSAGFDTFVSTPSSANLASLVTDETGSGSLVFGTSPTFTTDIKTPIVYGSTSASGTLTLGSTSNATKGTIQIGSTDIVNIGNAVTTGQRLVRIGQDTSYLDIGSYTGSTSQPAIYVNTTSPSSSNYVFTSDGASTLLNGSSSVYLRVGNSDVLRATSTSVIFSSTKISGTTNGLLTFENTSSTNTGATTNFTFNTTANTGQTSGTNIPNFKVTGSTKTWAAGALATQYFNYFSSNTVAFASASTLTNCYSLFVEASVQGSNATITNNYAAGFSGNVEVTGFLKTPSIYASGNISSVAWTTNGVKHINVASTLTDTTSSGTVSSARTNTFGGNTISASNSTTFTNYYANFFTAETQGTNVTFTNNWAVGTNGNIEARSAVQTKITSISTATNQSGVLSAENDNSAYARLSCYGSAFGITEFRNNGAFGFKNSGYVISDGDVANGGTNSIYFMTGGYTPSTQTRLTIDSNGNTIQGIGALATNATNGFLYIESCAGTPTGVPTTVTGRVPIIYDTTNNKFYIYNGGWKSVTLA